MANVKSLNGTDCKMDIRQLVHKVIIDLGLFIFCMLPGIILSYNTLPTPWTMFRMSRATLAIQDNYVPDYTTAAAGYRAEHIGGELLQVTLAKGTRWTSEWLLAVPIGSFLFTFLVYSITGLVCNSRISSAAITIFVSWYYPLLYSQYSTQTYAWAHALFVGFLILLWCWIHNRTPILSILIMVVFIGTFLHYHTTPLWIIAAIIVATLLLKLKDPEKTALKWALPVFCIVLYFAFDTIVYDNALVRIKNEVISESFMQSFLGKIVAPLFTKPPSSLLPFQMVTINPRIATWSTLTVLLLLTIPVGLWCIVKIYQVFHLRHISIIVSTSQDVFIWSVISAAVLHALMYSMYGAVSLRVIPLAFPLILPLVIQEFNWTRKLGPVLECVLAISAIVGFVSFASTLEPPITSSNTGMASKLIGHDARILGDANFFGYLLLNMANDGKIADLRWIDSDLYSSLVGQTPLIQNEFDYLIIDFPGQPMISKNWGFFEPLAQHIIEINQNSSFDKIYDSQNMMLFQTNGIPLSHFQITAQDIASGDRTLAVNTIEIFIVVLILFFIPGVVFLLITCTSSISNFVFDIRTKLGLAISLSIAFITFISYIANFTIGLNYLLFLCIVLPIGVLAMYMLVSHNHFSPNLSEKLHLLTGIIIILTWAFLSSTVAQVRTQRNAEFVEFFVTRANLASEQIAVNVVNRLDQAIEFTISLKVNEDEIKTLGPNVILSNSIWVENLDFLNIQTGDRLEITLEREGLPDQELHLSNISH